jgi:hypothetical protein
MVQLKPIHPNLQVPPPTFSARIFSSENGKLKFVMAAFQSKRAQMSSELKPRNTPNTRTGFNEKTLTRISRINANSNLPCVFASQLFYGIYRGAVGPDPIQKFYRLLSGQLHGGLRCF